MAEKKEKVKKEAKAEKPADKKAEAAGADAAKAEVKEAPNATLQKKRERREAKAARKAANKVEEKKSRPNNILLAVLIFGVLIAMFGVVAGYNYFSKPESLEKYIEDNGGEDIYGNFLVDENTKANITAEGNSLKMELTAETDDEELIRTIKESYADDGDGKENMDDMAAYFLTSLKPQTRGFGGDVTATMKLNDEELSSVKMTYNEAKQKMKEAQKKAEEEAEAAEDADTTDSGDSGDNTIEVDADDVQVETDDGAAE